MKKPALKALICALCASLALVSGLVLTGCSDADPKKMSSDDFDVIGFDTIKLLISTGAVFADLTTNFDEIKNLDDAAIEELAEEMGSTGLEDYGIETVDLIASMAEGFDYTINSVTVDGDTATASVTVTCKSATELMDLDYGAMTEDLLEAVEAGEVDVSDEASVNTWTGEYLMGLLDALEPAEKDLDLTYVNGSDGWELDDDSRTAVDQIFA